MNENNTAKTLDDLSSTEFEGFCFDLLVSMGFVNVDWRKGTGLDSSPADGGRDIECAFPRSLPDGRQELEKWLVECKHGKTAVSKERILGFLASAQAMRPDRALIIASNYFSNATKDWLREWKQNGKPPFSIQTWERKDIERHMSGKPLLLRKYGLAGAFPFLRILHPAHIRYMQWPPLNSLDYFFGLLDKLLPEERRRFFGFSFLTVLKPRTADPPIDFKGTMADLLIDPCNYDAFKAKCFQMAQSVDPSFLVKAIVNESLPFMFHPGDLTAIQSTEERQQGMIEFFKKRIADGRGRREVLENLVAMTETMKAETPRKAQNAYDDYVSFCEKIVTPLFEEKIEPEMSDAVREFQQQAIEDIGG